jgi:hypothetical protein
MRNREKIYICDPKKNEKCKKTACQTLCFCTLNEECKATGLEWLKHKIAEMKGGE